MFHTKEDIRKLAGKFGEILELNLPKGRDKRFPNSCAGFCFIQFKRKMDAEIAKQQLKLNFKHFNERKITLDWAINNDNWVTSQYGGIEEKTVPIELLSEIINFLPLNSKWIDLQISINFYFFAWKAQYQWILHLRKIVDPARQIIQRVKNSVISFHAYFDKFATEKISLNAVEWALLCFRGCIDGISLIVVPDDCYKFWEQMNALPKEDTLASVCTIETVCF
uniref:RRM domain-containing protein n=2 Tax=Meloidogyne TaxID=189290 RepID=A0A6V7UR27_MELEN|nr:unnamed protein product [Meloidogyne enterolobii]